MANQKITTPLRYLVWVNHQGEGKESQSGKLEYRASAVLDPKNNLEDAAFVAQIEAYWEENKAKGRRKPKSNGLYLCEHDLDADGEKQYDDDDNLIYKKDGKVHVTDWNSNPQNHVSSL